MKKNYSQNREPVAHFSLAAHVLQVRLSCESQFTLLLLLIFQLVGFKANSDTDAYIYTMVVILNLSPSIRPLS